MTGKHYDYINPDHYKQEDGKETWERMVDIWGVDATALWCEMTAFKYQERIGKKPGESVERETEKINWYIKKAYELRYQNSGLAVEDTTSIQGTDAG